MMRKSPTFLAAVFILITLVRVAEFSQNRMHAGWMGWAFSVAMGLGVFIFAWFTREHIILKEGEDRRSKTVQNWAWGGLIIFVMIDGLFNTAEVWLASNPTDLLMKITTAVYGAFPTLASAALGALQGHVDRLPVPPVSKNAIIPALRRMIASRINSLIAYAPDAESVSAHPVAAAHPAPQAIIAAPAVRALPAHTCLLCGASCKSQQSLAAHMRWTHPNALAGSAHPIGSSNGTNGAHHEPIGETRTII